MINLLLRRYATKVKQRYFSHLTASDSETES